jgi:predicted Zn-dependent peptidase
MKYLRLKISAILFMLPILTNISSFPLHGQERFRQTSPLPDPFAKLQLPEVESDFLSNGLALTVIRKEGLPVISLRLIVLTGESHSPESLPGLATLTARMVQKGSVNMSSERIEEEIESIGGTFSSETLPDYTVYSFSFLDEYFEKAIEILSKMIIQPEFSQKEISNVKRDMYYSLVSNNSNPEFLAQRLLYHVLFNNHVYKKSAFTDDVVKNLGRKDLLTFFGKFFAPNNSTLVLVGNLNLSTAGRIVSRYLNIWERKNIDHYYFKPPDNLQKQKYCFIDLPKARDATVFLGSVIPPQNHKDYFSFLVLNQVIGGTYKRLYMNLRESKQYAYYAYSTLEFFKTCGIFCIKTRVRPEVTADAITECLNELKSISTKKIPNYEIQQAKSYLLGNFPLTIENYDDLSDRISMNKALNLDDKHWDFYSDNIKLVTSDKVFETVKNNTLLNPVIVIIGDKDVLLKHLKDLDEIEIYDNKGQLIHKITKGEEK